MRRVIMKFNSIRFKLITISLLLLAVPTLVIGILSFNSAKSSLDDLGKVGLKNDVRMAIKLIDSLNREVESGNITLEKAQEQVKVSLLGEKNGDGTRPIDKTIDIGENGYLFVMDKEGKLLAHPASEGNNIWGSEDPNGVKVGKSIIEAAINGDGFSYYSWPLPSNPDEIAPKVTYAEVDSNWGWVVSAGTYTQDFNKSADNIFATVVITLGISLLVGIGVILLFVQKLIKPIVQISEQVNQVSNGNLDVEALEVKSKDEVGKLAHDFNIMTKSLKEFIEQVSSASHQVAATSEQLTSSAEETSKATEQIAESIQEVAAGADQQVTDINQINDTVNEISNGMDQISSNIQSVTDAAAKAANNAESGNEVINQTAKQMNKIQLKSHESSKVVNILDQKSTEINNIISLITDISEQTNLLALNAAIEAARAGEHGKGFAVVADEVRKLAEQSNGSAGKISQLITEIQKETQRAVQSMDEGNHAVEEGMSMVNQAGKAFKDIYEAVEQVSNETQEVSAAIQQINAGTQDMVYSMNSITEISNGSAGNTQQVASASEEQNASMEEISAAANTLSEMAEELQHSISRYKI
jgi:methyl-accepting chemotaxis protein